MARARAIAQFTDCVKRIRVLVLFVWIWPEVARMAAGAVWLVSRCWPGNYFRVATVAICAGQLPPMLARVGSRCMPEQQRFPGVRRVTGITVLAGNKMPGWLALGSAAVVAA